MVGRIAMKTLLMLTTATIAILYVIYPSSHKTSRFQDFSWGPVHDRLNRRESSHARLINLEPNNHLPMKGISDTGEVDNEINKQQKIKEGTSVGNKENQRKLSEARLDHMWNMSAVFPDDPDSKYLPSDLETNHKENEVAGQQLPAINDANRTPEEMDNSLEFNMTAVELDMKLRSKRVREACMNIPRVSPDYRKFFFDRKHKLAWCPIYKAASSSWLENFCILGGVNTEKNKALLRAHNVQMNQLARKAFPSTDLMLTKKLLELSLSFIIVRHPFERLLSAYRDKLEKREKREWYYQRYGKRIVQLFRHKVRRNNGIYRKFVKRRIHGHLQNSTKNVKDGIPPGPKQQMGPEPTFEEFVTYLISTKSYDEHWRPFNLECAPCVVNYDVIAKFETLQRDQNYIILKKNLQHLLKPKWSHWNKEGKTSEVAEKYFSKVKKENITELYRAYQADFKMFNYSPDKYIDMGKP